VTKQRLADEVELTRSTSDSISSPSSTAIYFTQSFSDADDAGFEVDEST